MNHIDYTCVYLQCSNGCCEKKLLLQYDIKNWINVKLQHTIQITTHTQTAVVLNKRDNFSLQTSYNEKYCFYSHFRLLALPEYQQLNGKFKKKQFNDEQKVLFVPP